MPFNAKAVERDIDKDCSDEGTGKGMPQQAQNRAKNNFAAKGEPIPILITDIDRLEKATILARNCFAKHGSKCRQLAIDSAGLPSRPNHVSLPELPPRGVGNASTPVADPDTA